jgi:hypothetical protein
VELFRPSKLRVERYRYRGMRILLPWMEPTELGGVGRYAYPKVRERRKLGASLFNDTWL